MNNKILKLSIEKNLQVLNKGGGTPEYHAPENLLFIDKLIKEFESFYKKVKNTNENVSFILTHKDNFPAIANRFVESMKTIFGDKSYEYKTTKLIDEGNEEILNFIYEANEIQLSDAIYRLNEIKIYLNETLSKMNLKIEEWFKIISEKKPHPYKIKLEFSIKDYFRKMSIPYVSKTSLLKLLSSGFHKYKKLEFLKEQSINSSDEEDTIKFVSFVSENYANKSIKSLNESKIKFNKVDKSTISINSNEIKRNIDLKGILYVENIKSKKEKEIHKTNDNFNIYGYLQKDQTKNNVNIGVIDGGLQNEEFKKYVTYHGIDEFETLLPKPSGTHGEEVCSILLYGNKLSPSLNDNCYQPNIHLFDVVYDNIYADKLLELIEKILEKYHKTIKIWNLSIMIENSIIESTIWKNGISFFGNKLDKLQKKYNVLFVVPTGNKTNENSVVLNSPSDSMLAISVGCSNYNETPAKYSLSGMAEKNKFFAVKPDLAVRAENNEGQFTVLSNGIVSKNEGTSFAAPWVARKVAHLAFLGIDLFAIPALLNAFTIFKNKTEKINDIFGSGILPININEIINFGNDKAIAITKLNVKDYSQGFFDLKLPKSEDNNFPLNFVMGVNVIPNFSDVHSFEYIEDTARVQFGAVSPFNISNHPKLEQNWKILPIRGDADDAYTKERSLRQYFGKYKNRYTNVSFNKRPKKSRILKNGEYKEIENWGFSIVRNDIRTKRIDGIDVYICLIVSNINGNEIYNDISNLNKHYMNLELDIQMNDKDDIKFE